MDIISEMLIMMFVENYYMLFAWLSFTVRQLLEKFNFEILYSFNLSWTWNKEASSCPYIILTLRHIYVIAANDNNIWPQPSSTCFQHPFHYTNQVQIRQIWQNLNEHYYYLTLTKSVICQMDANCSPFQWLNMLPFHIRLEHLKLIYQSLVSTFFKCYFKIGTLCLLFCLHK